MDVSQPGDRFTVVMGPNAPNHARSFVPQALSPNDTESGITATFTNVLLTPHVIKVAPNVTHKAEDNHDGREDTDIISDVSIRLFRVTLRDGIIQTNKVEQSTITRDNTRLTTSPIDVRVVVKVAIVPKDVQGHRLDKVDLVMTVIVGRDFVLNDTVA